MGQRKMGQKRSFVVCNRLSVSGWIYCGYDKNIMQPDKQYLSQSTSNQVRIWLPSWPLPPDITFKYLLFWKLKVYLLPEVLRYQLFFKFFVLIISFAVCSKSFANLCELIGFQKPMYSLNFPEILFLVSYSQRPDNSLSVFSQKILMEFLGFSPARSESQLMIQFWSRKTIFISILI